MHKFIKRKDGFEGEKMIKLPYRLQKTVLDEHFPLFQLYVSQIGYFPNANGHYKERNNGCDDNILIYCLKGKGFYRLAGKQFEVSANQFFILPSGGEPVSYWADECSPWTIYWVHFNGPSICKFNRSLNLDVHSGPVNIPFNAKAIDIWHDMYKSLENGFTLDNLCNTSFCLHNFIATFLFPEKHSITENKQENPLVSCTVMHMQANLSKKLTVEEMASKQNLSCSRFSNLFRKATGMPPNDFFIHLRMQKACELLDEYESRIKAVAGYLGYDDPYYFSRIFKKHIGVSPESYRIASRKQSFTSVRTVAVV